ncbi:MAG: hypothetical protein M1836_007621 [Candelina mexicana]|nr:MAG: hypothetical protein M1836_007621 [Candelina mexicana]
MYRCPGCALRTCSLPCTKRHKAWYQCSGARNPAAYVKSKDLATPAGIDRDFNFLTGIERAFDEADRDAEARGIVIDEPRRLSAFPKNAKKGVILRQEAIERTGVIVDRAPKGMTREKHNQTRWLPNQKCLSWTVEWIHQDGSRDLEDCLETLGLCERYATLLRVKKSRQNYRPGKKLKRSHNPKSSIDSVTDSTATEPAENANSIAEITAEAVSLQPTSFTPDAPPEPIYSGLKRKPIDESAAASTEYKPIPPTSEPLITLSTDPETPPDYYFYLLRPHTASSSHVLIPISSSAPLKESLNNQIVLEFPTIYALKNAPDALPEGFIQESEYLGQSRAEAQELDELLSKVRAPDLEEGEVEDGEKALQEAMDKKRLLDVLRRDLIATR